MIARLKNDSIPTGIFLGIVSIALCIGIIFLVQDYYADQFNYRYLQSPRLQLILLAINLIIFRLVMLRYKKFETGKGMLLVLFITTIIYLILHRQFL